MINYKYLHPDRKTYFQDSLLRFSPPGAMNDPYECLPAPKAIDPKSHVAQVVARNEPILMRGKNSRQRAIFRKGIKLAQKQLVSILKKNPDSIPALFIEKYQKHANAMLGIFSLSRRFDSTLMWAHYADSHKGFAIGFDSTHAFFQRQADDLEGSGTLENVVYSKTRLEVPIEPLQVPPELFLQKHDDWKYEEEVRLVRLLSKADKTCPATPLACHLFKVPFCAVTELIFGINASKSLYDWILDEIAKQPDLCTVKVFQAVMDKTSFKINKHPL